MKNTAVVFGATGLIGNELVGQLLKDPGYEKVVIVTRHSAGLKDVKLEEIALADFTHLNEIKNKLSADVYYCCIGTTIKTAGSQSAFKRVDFNIPLSIAQLANDLRIPNLVVISSIGANAESGNFYLRTKGEMENAVRSAYGGNLKIVRPSLLIGNRKEYRFAEKFSVVFMKAFGWLLIGSLKKYRGIQDSIVAKAMVKSTGFKADKVFIESDELHEMA